MSDGTFVHGCVKEKTKASGVGSGENHLTSDLQSKESCETSQYQAKNYQYCNLQLPNVAIPAFEGALHC